MAFALIVLSGDVEPNPGFRCLADIKKTRGLKIAHLNIRSLRNKTDSLRLELRNNSIDVLTLSETWLNSTIQDAEIQLPGYTCVRRDRDGHKIGGGIIIYIWDGLPFAVRNDLYNGENELLWIELIRKVCKPTLICCTYRAPDSNLDYFITGLRESFSLLNTDKLEIILLDFNVDYSQRISGCQKLNKQKLNNFMRSLDVSSYYRAHKTYYGMSVIDWLNLCEHWTSHCELWVVSFALSDHSLVFCVVKSGVIKGPPRVVAYRSYKHFDADSFTQDLKNIPWHLVQNDSEIHDAVLTWNELFFWCHWCPCAN